MFFAINPQVFPGNTTQVSEQIKRVIANYINRLTNGDDVLLSRLYTPANLGVQSGVNSKYYDINSLAIGKSAAIVMPANVVTTFNKSASCSIANIALTMTT